MGADADNYCKGRTPFVKTDVEHVEAKRAFERTLVKTHGQPERRAVPIEIAFYSEPG